MALDKQTFFTRLGSAAIFSAVMLCGLLGSAWIFIALFLIITIISLKEFTILVEKITQTNFSKNEKMNVVLMGAAIYLLIATLPIHISTHPIAQIMYSLRYYFGGIVIGTLVMFFLFKRQHMTMYLLSGIGYVAMPLGLLVQLRFQHEMLPLVLILLIWMNDTMAYLSGSMFGKTPMAPSISPKKTIEGTLGGILFTIAMAAAWGYINHSLPVSMWIGLACTASVIGTIGDLVESKLKRMAQVKDSGNMMPGHGGALDRFDSLLFAAPFAYILSLILM